LATSQSRPIRPIQCQHSNHPRSRRTTHKPAPRVDDRTRHPTPVPATKPTNCRTSSTVRSGTAPNPKVHRQPKSIRSQAPTPSYHHGTEPNQQARWAPKPVRSPARFPNVHWRPDLPRRYSSDWCDSTTSRCESSGRGRCSSGPNRRGQELPIFCTEREYSPTPGSNCTLGTFAMSLEDKTMMARASS